MSGIHEPKCPSCKIIGKSNIVSSKSDSQSGGGDPWFEIAHCAKCGHVYGVFAKVVNPPKQPKPFG